MPLEQEKLIMKLREEDDERNEEYKVVNSGMELIKADHGSASFSPSPL